MEAKKEITKEMILKTELEDRIINIHTVDIENRNLNKEELIEHDYLLANYFEDFTYQSKQIGCNELVYDNGNLRILKNPQDDTEFCIISNKDTSVVFINL